MPSFVSWATLFLVCGLLAVGLVLASGEPHETEKRSSDSTASPESSATLTEAPFRHKTLRGRFVWMNEALHRRHGVQTPIDLRESIPSIEMKTGELVPLIEDKRGGSFRRDQRLREMDLELELRFHRGSPMGQIVHLYQHEKGKRYVIDYWCDICSITMFEFGPCDCCQDQNRLRRRVREATAAR